MKSSNMLFPQMKISNYKNNYSTSGDKGYSQKDKIDFQYTTEQFLRMRNNGYFAGETIGSIPQINSIRASNNRGSLPQKLVTK